MLVSFLTSMGASVLTARFLGPEGKGVYALILLLPSLVVIFANLGVGTATTYLVSQRSYPLPQVLGSTVFLGLSIGGIGLLCGLLLVLSLYRTAFLDVPKADLFLCLVFIPANVIFLYLQGILLGMRRVVHYNAIILVHSGMNLLLIAIALCVFRSGVHGLLVAQAAVWFFVVNILFFSTRRVVGNMRFSLDTEYLRQIFSFGAKSHVGYVLSMMHYRADILLVGFYLGPVQVGFYSISTALAERLWMGSLAVSTVLFPRLSEKGCESRRNELTPLVARTILLMTGVGAVTLALLARFLVCGLYSEVFLPSVQSLQALLAGVVALSVSRVLASDIASRGHPMLNSYVGAASFALNIILNVLWIPRYGIVGAAWASTTSYGVASLGQLLIYCRLSGISWTSVLLVQRADLLVFHQVLADLFQWVRSGGQGLLGRVSVHLRSKQGQSCIHEIQGDGGDETPTGEGLKDANDMKTNKSDDCVDPG